MYVTAIDVPDGYEFIIKDTTVTVRKIVEHKVEYWEDLKEVKGFYITDDSLITDCIVYNPHICDIDRNIFKTEAQAKACLATSMYSQLRVENDSYEILCEYLDKMHPILEIAFGKDVDAHIALLKLKHLRDEINGGWSPDWDSDELYACISVSTDTVELDRRNFTPTFLVFETVEKRDAFLQDYGKLISIAKDYL